MALGIRTRWTLRSDATWARTHRLAGYQAPVPLSPAIRGFPTMVGPDEQYLIVSADLPGGFGARDLYILFRRADGGWDEPVNMGPRVNSPAIEALASITPDRKYFFVASERGGDFDVYWLDARVIEELKNRRATREQG